MNLEDLVLRVYEDTAYLSYSLLDHFNIEPEPSDPKYVKLREVLSRLTLPANFSFLEDSLELEYEIPMDGSESGYVCDLASLKEKFEAIIKYLGVLLNA